MSHPRQKHYPHHEDYVKLANEFRPFVMFTHTPYYRSRAVNTDKLGLREHYDDRGSFVDIERAKETYASVNILVGGSTVFGVDATGDRTTIAHALNTPGAPCLNFGIRGGVPHQELQSVLLLRRFLPRIERVVLLTGVNLASMASLADTMFYPEFGGIFSEPWHYDAFCDQYKRFTYDHQRAARRLALSRVDRWFEESKWGRRVARWLVQREPPQTPPELPPPVPFEQKLALLESQFAVDLDVWAALQQAWGMQVDVVLQPCAGWTKKLLAPIEAECIAADRRAIPSISLYANRKFYEGYTERLAARCAARGLPYYDSNRWLDDLARRNDEFFTDICHLTDLGNDFVARLLRQHLGWKEEGRDQSLGQAA